MNGNYDLIASSFLTGLPSRKNPIAEAFSVIPVAIAEPIYKNRELDAKKEILIKMLECDTADRAKICEVIKELSRNGDLTDARLCNLLVLYAATGHIQR